MSKLQEMITRLCPDGVPYKPFGELLDFRRGSTITERDSIPGDYPVIAGGQKPAYYHNVFNREGETIAVAGSGAYAGFVSWWTTPIFLSDAFSVHPKDDSLLPKYIYYIMKNMQEKIHNTKKGSGVPHVHGSSIAKFLIPIPPIEVQEEIVRVLDRFADYAAELQAELQARKQQYEFYRNQLLSFPSADDLTTPPLNPLAVTWKPMAEICKNICSGGTPRTSVHAYYQGTIPWLRTQEVDWKEVYDTGIKISEDAVANSSAKMIPSNCVIIAMYGATAAKCCINKIPLTTNQACCNLEIDDEIANYKYVYHWICNNYNVLKGMGEGSQNNINAAKIRNFMIPIPAMEEQERIVGILDRFEALVNDLTEGLPAEIAAVKEQYEYYRNRLLTFKQLCV